MKYKMRLAALFSAAILTTTLTACGTSGASSSAIAAEPAASSAEPDPVSSAELSLPISLADIRTENELLTLLKDCDTVIIKQQTKDADGNIISLGKRQYIYDEDLLQMDDYIHYLETDNSAESEYYKQGYAAEDYSGALYAYNDGIKSMTCYPADEYEQILAQTAQSGMVSSAADIRETVDSWDEKDDILTIATTSRYAEAPNYYKTIYKVDTKTKRMQSQTITNYLSGDTVSDVTTYAFVYNEDYKPARNTARRILNSDGCALKLVIQSGKDTETQTFHVDHDTSVFFDSLHNYTIYKDEKMTQAIDPNAIDVTGDAETLYVKLEN